MDSLDKISISQIDISVKDSSMPNSTQKSPEITIESGFNEQSNENINSFIFSETEISDQNDLDLILKQDNANDEYSVDMDQKTSKQLLEDNKKLVAENQKLRSSLSVMKKSQNSSTIDSLKSKINELELQLRTITSERDELKTKVEKLSEDLKQFKEPIKQTQLPNKNENDNKDDISDSNDHLININKGNESNTKSNSFVKDSDILTALGLIENMIGAQSNDISFISMQKNALFELSNKLMESNKELENQLSESIEYASELEKNHINLEQKCIELQDKTDIEMDYLLTSIINIISTYQTQKYNSKKTNKAQTSQIIESFNKKVQQKLAQIQDQTLSSQIVELFKLTVNNYYQTVDDLVKANSQNQSLNSSLFNFNNNQKVYSQRELALLGHLENAIRYIHELTNTSKMSLREDERTFIIAQISRLSNFIEEEVDIESISNYASLFNHTNLEAQILTFFDFVNKEEEEEENSEDKETNNNEEEEEEENIGINDADEKLFSIRKKENSCVMIKDTPVRELYNLFKATIVVNSIMYDHFDRIAEEIVQLKTELTSVKENKNKYEQQYNKIAERVDDMSSELGRLFYSIQQQEQKNLPKNTKNTKNKKSKIAKKSDTSSSKSNNSQTQSENAYADDPFIAVSQLIDSFVQLREENNKQKKTIKSLTKNVNDLKKKEEVNNTVKDLESQILQLKKENGELNEKFTNMNEMTKENSDLKNEVSEALKKVELLQIKANKMKEKKKEEEEKAAHLTQQLQLLEKHNFELKNQFNSIKEIATKSTNIIRSYKEKEKRLIERILSLENIVSQSEINENTKQREINEVKKLQMLQSKQNEETKEKYESQLKQLNAELQAARTKIQQMEEEASAMAKTKDTLQRDVAKLKLVEKTLEMKLKQQETHSLSVVNIERSKCESKIMMAKSQMEENLSEHEKRLTKIKYQLLQIVREFFPESYNAAVRSSNIAPSVASTETATMLNKSPNKSTVSEIQLNGNQYSPSLLEYASSSKNANFTSPQYPSNQTETQSEKLPVFSFLYSPPNQQQTDSASPQQFSSPATVFTSVSNQQNSRPFASLDMLCDSVEASLDSVRTCVSRSDFHNNASTVQEANKVRAQLGMKSSGSLLKKFSEMSDKIDELEAANRVYKEKYNKLLKEKKKFEKELLKTEPIRNELRNWEKWGNALFRQINSGVTFAPSLSKSNPENDSSNSSSLAAILNDTDDSDVLELNDLTNSGKKSSPFKVIPLISFDEIRAALEESVLASIGHRAMLRKIGVLRVQKQVVDIAYRNLFELVKPIVVKQKGKVTPTSEAALALRKLKKNFNYFFCFMLNSNVRFAQLNEDPPNNQYALCSIRHLILIYVFLKRIEKFSGFVPVIGSNSLTVSKENELRTSMIDLDD